MAARVFVPMVLKSAYVKSVEDPRYVLMESESHVARCVRGRLFANTCVLVLLVMSVRIQVSASMVV